MKRKTRSSGAAEAESAVEQAPAPAPEKDTKKFVDPTDEETLSEFGGPVGCLFVICFSHVVVYYIWLCLTYYDGALTYPSALSDVVPWLSREWNHILAGASPSWYAAQLYFTFIGAQALFAVTLPGVDAFGLPLTSLGGKRLLYKCNGLASWYVTLVSVFVLHYSGVFRFSTIIDNLGPLTTVSVIFSDLLSLGAYFSAVVTGKAHRMSNNFIYDFFMGAWLNPRIGNFDLKFWGETRVAWLLLYVLTIAAAVTQFEQEGTICLSMYYILVAHGLYCNAVFKGEECIPPTWDIYYEKWGWMLIFWNFAGVPFVYCCPAIYIMKHGLFDIAADKYIFVLLLCLIFAYYVWDTSQSQKSRCRQSQKKPRNTFPQLPWGTLTNPKVLQTKAGSFLLIDGWWAYARKIHYAADIFMSFSWGLCCGFSNFLPYFYPIFFTSMIIHRYTRDVARCKKKYKDDWDRYIEIVPSAFIPYVI